MRSLLDPLNVELDAETQAICDEVCEALEWYDPEVPGSTEMARAFQFGHKWGIAGQYAPDPACRRKVFEACEAIVRADDELVITVQGHIFTRDQVREYHGRQSYVVDSQTGEYRELIEWPTGTYANGSASYERPEDRNAA